MKIEHSNQINDFIMFFIETKVDGNLRYETAIDYYQSIFWITDLKKRIAYKFEFNATDEAKVIEEIKRKIEKIAFQDYDKISAKEVSINNIENQIKEATSELIEMGKEYSWNKIDDDVKYVIKKIDLHLFHEKNLFELNKIRKRILNQQPELSLKQAAQELILTFENIYSIELYIFKSIKKKTIVEIEILEKSELNDEYRKIVQENAPSLHCKVAIPPYIEIHQKEKFDINWQLGTTEFYWRLFWYKLTLKIEKWKSKLY